MIRTGIDVVDIGKFVDRFLKNDKFATTVFLPREIEYAENRRKNCEDVNKKYQTYAGLYAAKESVVKAVGKGIVSLDEFKKFEICHDDLGRPFVVGEYLSENGIKNIDVSISHDGGVAVASCFVEL